MTNYTLILYKRNKDQITFQDSQKALIENLDTFLLDFETEKFDNLQPVNIDSNISIKLPLSSFKSVLSYYNNDFWYAQLNIEENDIKTYYFFINGIRRLGEETVELHLNLDTINTFQDYILNSLTARTYVEREHRDRFQNIVTYKTSTYNNFYFGEDTHYGDYSFQVLCVVPNVTGTITADDIEIYDSHQLTTERASVISEKYVDGTYQCVIEFLSSEHYSIAKLEAVVHWKNVNVYRKIDFSNENLNPLLFKTEVGAINKDYGTWYLVYASQNTTETENNPVNCYLFPETSLEVTGLEPTLELKIASLTDTYNGNYVFILKEDNPVGTVTTYGKKTNNSDYIYESVSIENKNNIRFRLKSGGISEGLIVSYAPSGEDTFATAVSDINRYDRIARSTNSSAGLSLYNINVIYVTKTTAPSSFINNQNPSIALIKQYCDRVELSSSVTTLKGYDELDKTIARIIKSIKLPYCPSKVDYENNLYFSNVGENGQAIWTKAIEPQDENMGTIKLLNSSNCQFGYSFISDLENPLTPLFSLSNGFLDDININRTRTRENESKLYHSEFYQPKIYYDSFSKSFNLEQVDSTAINIDFTIYFKMTSTINSNMLFDFVDYNTNGKSLEDYDSIMYISRSNEMTLYNNAYINYIKNGYNYDRKAQYLTLATNIGTTGLATVGGLATGGIGGAVTGFVSGAIHTISSAISSEQSIQSKKAQLMNQATSIAGANDVDLMSYYSGNKLRQCIYKVSDNMSNMLNDLFFYYGYNTQRTLKPVLNSRIWFNYLQCEPYFDTKTYNVIGKYIPLITEELKNGITIYHKYNNTWDLSQEKENYERWLITNE